MPLGSSTFVEEQSLKKTSDGLRQRRTVALVFATLVCLSGLSAAFCLAAIIAGHLFLGIRAFSGAVLLTAVSLLAIPLFDRDTDV